MERRKGQILKVITGKRTAPVPQLLFTHKTKPLSNPKPSTSTSYLNVSSQAVPPTAQVVEYKVRVPKNKKQHNLMRFNAALNVDFGKWSNVRIQREDNSHLYKQPDFGVIDLPKFGAGSEYGREQREEARRRKYGINRKKYKKEDQPWMLKVGTGDTNRKFKGLREGGVNENASYFVFTQAHDGCFDVFPIQEWYNFTPIQRYKALSAEEAEEQFKKRSKIMNLFSVMIQKRMRDDKEEVEEEKSDRGGGGKAKQSDMQVTDMDDWVEEMDDEDETDEDDKLDKSKKKLNKKKEKKDKDSDDDLNIEDSDDGDEEGREQDYMSDISSSSDDEEEKKPELPGIDQDENLRALLESGSSSEEENEDGKKEDQDETDDAPQEGGKKKSKKKKKSEKKTALLPDAPALLEENNVEKDESKSTMAKDAVVAEVKAEISIVKDEPNPLKRKATESVSNPQNKKPKVDLPSSIVQLAAVEGITEEAVRKYLLRKPMTTAELLQKFKKTRISSSDMVPIIAHILKKLNPATRVQQNKTYFFINNKTS